MWNGSISFGLVTIPVALYPATRREELAFKLLRKTDLSPINNKRVAQADGQEVAWDDIVKGYEYEKGKYAIIEPAELKSLRLAGKKTIEVSQFSRANEIDPALFEKPYFVMP